MNDDREMELSGAFRWSFAISDGPCSLSLQGVQPVKGMKHPSLPMQAN